MMAAPFYLWLVGFDNPVTGRELTFFLTLREARRFINDKRRYNKHSGFIFLQKYFRGGR